MYISNLSKTAQLVATILGPARVLPWDGGYELGCPRKSAEVHNMVLCIHYVGGGIHSLCNLIKL